MADHARILVVDDESEIRETVSEFLQIKRQHQLTLASNGEEAYEYLMNNKYDLVISDVMMPKLDGINLLLTIRSNFKNLKVILMTGYFSDQLNEIARKNGVVHFLSKPIDFNHLLKSVDDILGIEPKVGYDGKMTGFDLADYISLICLSQQSKAITVRSHSIPSGGTIYIDGGQVVHAVVMAETGETAFRRIMQCQNGSIKVLDDIETPTHSIHKPWNNLLMEILVDMDEDQAPESE